MRASNLLITALGLGATGIAAAIAWRWRQLPIHPTPPDGDRLRHHLKDATRSFAAAMTAGAISGLLVLGFGGRLVMRILAASSGDGAQRRLTEAGERVGDITTGGTVAFLVFIGLGGGFVTALAYLVLRPLLPDQAGRSGLIGAVLASGTLGVVDPISPDNVDFAILSPLPLAVVLLLATAVLFTTTFTALAARFEQISAGSAPLSRRLPTMAVLPLSLLVPPIAVALAVYVFLRAAITRTTPSVERIWLRRTATAIVAGATVVTAATTARAVVEIL